MVRIKYLGVYIGPPIKGNSVCSFFGVPLGCCDGDLGNGQISRGHRATFRHNCAS